MLRPYQTRFRYGSGTPIPWPRCIPQLAGLFYKRHAAGLASRDILLVHGFRFYFTPLTGVLFAFPSRYSCTIGGLRVFSLGSWSTQIQTGFLVPRPTQVPHHGGVLISRTGLSPSSARLSDRFRYLNAFLLRGSSPCGPTTPHFCGLGSSPFARRYLGNLF